MKALELDIAIHLVKEIKIVQQNHIVQSVVMLQTRSVSQAGKEEEIVTNKDIYVIWCKYPNLECTKKAKIKSFFFGLIWKNFWNDCQRNKIFWILLLSIQAKKQRECKTHQETEREPHWLQHDDEVQTTELNVIYTYKFHSSMVFFYLTV